MTAQTNNWQDRVVSATRGNASQFGTILLAALGREPDAPPRFHGKAAITSDGFITAGFTDRDGRHHCGAFVGEVADLERNTIGLARHLNLDVADRAAFYRVVQAWIGIDYRDVKGLRFDGS